MSCWRVSRSFSDQKSSRMFLFDSEDCKTTNRPEKDYKSQDAQQVLTLTFVLRLIDTKHGLCDPSHLEPGPDPKTNAQEDFWGNLATDGKLSQRT